MLPGGKCNSAWAPQIDSNLLGIIVSYAQMHAVLMQSQFFGISFVSPATDILLQGINWLTQLTKERKEVPDLKGKSYGALKLFVSEWTSMELMQGIMQVRIILYLVISSLINL